MFLCCKRRSHEPVLKSKLFSDMGAAAVRSQQGTHVFMFSPNLNGQQANSTQFTSNAHPGFSNEMACEACNVNFNIFKRKKMCRECERYFCSRCVHRLSLKGQKKETFRQCKKCRILLTGSFTRQELIRWKVKDLKCLLMKRNISTDGCREKQELIDLIVINFGHMTKNDDIEERSDTESVISVDSQGQTPRPPQPTNSVPSSMPGQVPQPTTSPRQETDNERAARLRQRQQEELQQSEALPRPVINSDPDHNKEKKDAVPVKKIHISDINSLEDIDNLTVKDMKALLFRSFVDYKGCVEKDELKKKVEMLWKEHKANEEKAKKLDEPVAAENSGNGKSPEDEVCKICMDAMVDCVLLECGHMVSCTECGKRLHECPICRQYVVRVVRTFRS